MYKIRTSYNDMFYRAVLTLQNPDECAAFFKDLCTAKEIQSMAQRLMVAQMLAESRMYSDIVAATGVSTATVSRVNRSLQGGNGTYATVFARLQEECKNV